MNRLENNVFYQKIQKHLEDIDFHSRNIKCLLQCLLADNRVRNEDGESAFPLERPKTCTPIVDETYSTFSSAFNDKQEVKHKEFQYCPTSIDSYIKTAITKEQLKEMNIQTPEGLFVSDEEFEKIKSEDNISKSNELLKIIRENKLEVARQKYKDMRNF